MTHLNYFTPETVELKKNGSWKASQYFLDEHCAYALEMALITGRPLLVKGEPGIGKSQLARAAARQLECRFVSEVVNVNTEGQDLLWRFDPVARLNDAQIKENAPDLDQKHYINPGLLWWVFNWANANDYYLNVCQHRFYKPQSSDDYSPEKGIVLLLDEIDKADPSLPNSLLEVLGNGGFQIPLLGQTVSIPENTEPTTAQFPLVIITTNNERELPPAFLRRCLVLNLEADEKNLSQWLMERASVHFSPQDFGENIMEQAAEFLREDREKATLQGAIKPGLAEYIDLLTALKQMTQGESSNEARAKKQTDLMDKIRPYVLCKGE